MAYWLFKSDPDTYGWDQLVKDRQTQWNGIRNYQARNYLRTASVGDKVLIYHSGDDKAVMGIATVIRAGYPDQSEEWVQVDIEAAQTFDVPVELSRMKADRKLQGLMIFKQSRLSVMPISEAEFKVIESFGIRGTARKHAPQHLRSKTSATLDT